MVRLNQLQSLGTFKDFNDGTIKCVYEASGNIIEVTMINNKDNTDVFCVPTHHFCNLGCVLCHLTNKKLTKGMVPIKKDSFIEALFKTAYKKSGSALLNEEGMYSYTGNKYDTNIRRSANKKVLISFMGVGEPLLNMDLVTDTFKSESILSEICGYETIGYALSTMMPNDNLKKLAEIIPAIKMPLKVHFSMHSPFSTERFNLLPCTSVSVEEALAMLAEYREKVSKVSEIRDNISKFHVVNEPVEVHYTLVENMNDTDRHLEKVIELLSEYRIPIKFLRFNPVGEMKRSNRVEYWLSSIKDAVPGLRVTDYIPPGGEIGSSCGEFTKHYYHYEIESQEELQEFNEWKKKHEIFD